MKFLNCLEAIEDFEEFQDEPLGTKTLVRLSLDAVKLCDL